MRTCTGIGRRFADMATVDQVVAQDAVARERWLRERRSGLGGTDASAIIGVNPYASEMDVWLDKRGESAPIPDNPRMWWGRMLEPIVAHRYEVETGRKLWNPESAIYRHPEHDVLIGTPDRMVLDVPGGLGLDIKTAGVDQAHKWGEPGTDEIPDQYAAQCCHYMLVTGSAAWEVAVLIGGNDFRVYRLKRDVEFEAHLKQRLLDWWKKHMVEGVAPSMSGSRGVRDYLARRFPRETGPIIKATTEADIAAGRLGRARLALDEFEKDKAVQENILKSIIGEAAGIEGDGWRVSWKATKGRRVRNFDVFIGKMVDLVALTLTGDEAGNRNVAAEMVNAELEKATEEQAGVRRFVFTQPGGKS